MISFLYESFRFCFNRDVYFFYWIISICNVENYRDVFSFPLCMYNITIIKKKILKIFSEFQYITLCIRMYKTDLCDAQKFWQFCKFLPDLLKNLRLTVQKMQEHKFDGCLKLISYYWYLCRRSLNQNLLWLIFIYFVI